MTLQETIIKELGVKPSIDPKEEIRRSIDFLKDYLKNTHFENLCLGNFGWTRLDLGWSFGPADYGRNAGGNR